MAQTSGGEWWVGWYERYFFPGTRAAWRTVWNRGLRAALRDAGQLRLAVARLVAEGGLVVDFPPDAAVVRARFVLQTDGDVLLLGPQDYFEDPAAQAAHFAAIKVALGQVRQILTSVSALFIAGHTTILGGASAGALVTSLLTDQTAAWMVITGVGLSVLAEIGKRILLRVAWQAALRF